MIKIQRLGWWRTIASGDASPPDYVAYGANVNHDRRRMVIHGCCLNPSGWRFGIFLIPILSRVSK